MIKIVIIILGLIGTANLMFYYFSKNDNYKKITANISRIFTGMVFMFSGFVKGVDPLGTMYKIEDYFIAYKMEYAMPIALYLSIFLCAVEFSLGAFLFFNLKTKLSSLGILIMMSIFTVMTFFDAIYNPVPDCGCFGEAIKMTNWETFWKNIVIDTFLVVLYAYRNKYESILKNSSQWIGVLAVFISFIMFSIYNYRNLPVIDFTQWKIGTKIYEDETNRKPVVCYLIYKNKKTGEEKEYLSTELPYDDSLWVAEWEYKDRRIKDPNKHVSIQIVDKYGNDLTDIILKESNMYFIITAYDINKVSMKNFLNIYNLYLELSKKNIPFVVLTGSSWDEIEKFKSANRINESLLFCNADDIELKTMVRSTPGLMLIKKGIIKGKWHYNNVPNIENVNKLIN